MSERLDFAERRIYDSIDISSGSFEYLLAQYGYNDDSYGTTNWNSPIKLALTGYYWDGLLEFIGEYGYNWLSVLYNIEDAFAMSITVDGSASALNEYRPDGYNIRCLAR